jgi:hypothetical protein
LHLRHFKDVYIYPSKSVEAEAEEELRNRPPRHDRRHTVREFFPVSVPEMKGRKR